jgi:hypothetical protein
MTMTNMTTTDFNYDTIEYTIGMDSGRLFTCHNVEEFEEKALKDSLYESIPNDKPVKFFSTVILNVPQTGWM